ncbi:MAG: hypothetical protein AABX10_02060 [Nanoarchaeota archaeon]
MTKVDDKRRPLPNAPGTSKLIGDFYEHEWQGNKRTRGRTAGSYRLESYDHMAAAGEYRRALDSSIGEHSKKGLENLEARALKQAAEAERMAELYEQTKNYIAPFRWFLRFIRGSHIFGFFIFSLLLSDPLITGSLIRSSGEFNSFLGIILFFLGIVGCYLLFWKNHLMNRARDKY